MFQPHPTLFTRLPTVLTRLRILQRDTATLVRAQEITRAIGLALQDGAFEGHRLPHARDDLAALE